MPLSGRHAERRVFPCAASRRKGRYSEALGGLDPTTTFGKTEAYAAASRSLPFVAFAKNVLLDKAAVPAQDDEGNR